MYCNNVNYVKNNVIFEPPSMRACSSTPPKQNQDFVKEHNRTPLKALNLKDSNVMLKYSYVNYTVCDSTNDKTTQDRYNK